MYNTHIHARHLTEAGYNVYFVETDDTTHADVIKDSFSNDMPGYLAGRTPTLSGASGGGGGGFFKRRPTNYQTKKYNPETKEYYEANLSDAVVGNNSSGSSNTSEIKLVNLNEITGLTHAS